MFESVIQFEVDITEEKIIEVLYEVFKDNFIDNPAYLNENIFIDPRSKFKTDGKEDIFWHIITRDYDKNGKRTLDLERGIRIGWIKPVILNCNCDKVKVFYYKESNNKVRLYLWLYEKDFIVILQKLGKSSTYLVTSFYIDQKYKRETYGKRFENYINKKDPNLQGVEWF
ncbi:hypothetical protein [Cetobacterium sp.]|uniref:hypothetical protein n=1 Tax=Cetobacterium sp. TaxID=2071632 RepID=UPI003F2AEFB0